MQQELLRLRGERDGLRLRLQDLSATLAARPEAPSEGLASRIAELEAAIEAADSRDAEATRALATRDGLVARLQRDVGQAEDTVRHEQSLRRQLQDESDRLRTALIDASTAVDRSDALRAEADQAKAAIAGAEARVARAEVAMQKAIAEQDTLQAALDETQQRLSAAVQQVEHSDGLGEQLRAAEARLQTQQERYQVQAEAMRELRRLLDGLQATVEKRPETTTSEITAAGGLSAPPPAADLEKDHEQQLRDKDTLLRSLTAQLEERSDRIRALERRAAGDAPSGKGAELEEAMLELQERTSRLQEELDHERSARADAEQRLGQLERRPEAEKEISRLEVRLRRQEADLQAAMSKATSHERDVAALRAVFAEARNGLEELLGDATSSGDPTTADRIGALLSMLGRF